MPWETNVRLTWMRFQSASVCSAPLYAIVQFIHIERGVYAASGRERLKNKEITITLTTLRRLNPLPHSMFDVKVPDVRRLERPSASIGERGQGEVSTWIYRPHFHLQRFNLPAPQLRNFPIYIAQLPVLLINQLQRAIQQRNRNLRILLQRCADSFTRNLNGLRMALRNLSGLSCSRPLRPDPALAPLWFARSVLPAPSPKLIPGILPVICR